MEDKIGKLEEDSKDLRVILDSLTEVRVKSRLRESVKDMEEKLEDAQCAVKLLNIDIGRETQDKREIVRKTIESLRNYCYTEVRYLDKVLRRTKIVILGKGTTRRESSSGDTEFTVPTLFQCRDRRDAEELDGILRESGWFPTFHWPTEVMDLVNHARDEVRQAGYSEREYYVKVRPERREGRTWLKAEVKPKSGGRYVVKGLYACPPIHKFLWDSVPTLFESQLKSNA